MTTKRRCFWDSKRDGPTGNKFRPGRFLRTMGAVEKAITEGRWFYLGCPADTWRARPKHPAIIASMTFRTVLCYVRDGFIRIALENQRAIPF